MNKKNENENENENDNDNNSDNNNNDNHHVSDVHTNTNLEKTREKEKSDHNNEQLFLMDDLTQLKLPSGYFPYAEDDVARFEFSNYGDFTQGLRSLLDSFLLNGQQLLVYRSNGDLDKNDKCACGEKERQSLRDKSNEYKIHASRSYQQNKKKILPLVIIITVVVTAAVKVIMMVIVNVIVVVVIVESVSMSMNVSDKKIKQAQFIIVPAVVAVGSEVGHKDHEHQVKTVTSSQSPNDRRPKRNNRSHSHKSLSQRQLPRNKRREA